MASTITVEAKMLGQRKPLVADWHVSLPEGAPPATLRALIEQVVRAEVAAHDQRQEARRLTQVLSAQQIEAGVARGKVDMGGRDETAEAADPNAAVARALQAFEDGSYFVFLDDVQQTELDGRIELRSESRMLFLRLVALAGG
ncbi:MAG: hypothetical protein K0Q72_1905 [Armatimonadetes bacterium]|jgi:hypothetical protein|nr:hypothetical protein [Armatimonadota bacterium]